VKLQWQKFPSIVEVRRLYIWGHFVPQGIFLRWIFGFNMSFNVVSTPSGLSQVVGSAAEVLKQCIGNDGKRLDQFLRLSVCSL
jgi:hypothetical protein